MPASPDDLFAYLQTLRIPYQTIHHVAVFTVEESQKLRGDIAGAHVKNLFLKDKKSNLFLILLDFKYALVKIKFKIDIISLEYKNTHCCENILDNAIYL